VYEARTRAQGARAGLCGSDLGSTSWAMLPAADIEAIVVLRIWNSWGMSVSGGPTVHGLHGGARVAGAVAWGSHGNTRSSLGNGRHGRLGRFRLWQVGGPRHSGQRRWRESRSRSRAICRPTARPTPQLPGRPDVGRAVAARAVLCAAGGVAEGGRSQGVGLPGPFRFVPASPAPTSRSKPDVTATIDLINLPEADLMIGDLTARIAYASLIVYDDINGNGMLDLHHPPHHQRHEEDYNPGTLDTRDIVYGASFISMTKPRPACRLSRRRATRCQFRLLPRIGCPDPPPAFSILSASGFSVTSLAAAVEGILPTEDDLTECAASTLDETVGSRSVCRRRLPMQGQRAMQVQTAMPGRRRCGCAGRCGRPRRRQVRALGTCLHRPRNQRHEPSISNRPTPNPT